MLRDAWNEVRLHPGRFIATLVAIAISIGFIVATSVFLTTEKDGLGKAFNRQVSGSDIVVTVDGYSEEQKPTEVVSKIKAVDGVDAAEPLYQAQFSAEANDKIVYLMAIGTPGEPFRWSKMLEGTWPQGADQIALARDVAKKMNVKVGDTLEVQGQYKMKVSGITDDPKSIFMEIGYISQAFFNQGSEDVPAYTYNVKVKPGADVNATVNSLRTAVGEGFKVDTSSNVQRDSLNELTQGVDQMKLFMQIFTGIALIVGMIIIANTFTILLTQRRRQIGLLRAVGASTDQVRERFLAEALVLGAIGSLLGVLLGIAVSAIGSYFTGSLYWGLSLPWRDLAIAFVVGVVITVISAIAPVWRTSKVKPLEALQPVLNADAQKRVSRTRAIICGILAAIGVVLALMSIFGSSNWLLLSIFSAGFFTFAVLGAAPLYVAWLIRGFGKLVSWGPTSRLATMNAARNPGRAAATAVALMLAVGLIVTLQVGAATVKHSVLTLIDENYPVDVTVSSYQPEGLTEEQVQKLGKLPGVKSMVTVTGGQASSSSTGGYYTVVALPSDAKKISDSLPSSLPDDTVLAREDDVPDKTLTIDVPNGQPVTLKVQHTKAVDGSTVVVSEATMKKIVAKPTTRGVWIKLKDRGDFAAAMQRIGTMMQGNQGLSLGGGAPAAFLISSLVNVMLAIATALLGVAVAISLVGVANTLALSVIERTRESGLLRALGMKRSKLRLMLLIEAITLALVGTVIGVLAGSFFAWMGIRALFRQADIDRSTMKFAIDWKLTLGMIGVAVLAASLASILPGRKAALAAPTEALAVE